MKLRNKKTGEIVRVEVLSNYQTDDGTEFGFRDCKSNTVYSYDSLTELNEEWEDYAPKEPLIKDEKIRKIIRLWAKKNGATELKYYEGENCLEDMFRNEIHFNQALGLEDAKTYTTEELCGEEEE